MSRFGNKNTIQNKYSSFFPQNMGGDKLLYLQGHMLPLSKHNIILVPPSSPTIPTLKSHPSTIHTCQPPIRCFIWTRTPILSLSLSLSGVLYLPCDATVLTIYSDTFLTKPHLQSFINNQRLHFNHGFYNHEIIQSNGLNSTINYTVHTRRARVAVPMSVSGQLRLEIPHHHQSDAPTLFSLSFSL